MNLDDPNDEYKKMKDVLSKDQIDEIIGECLTTYMTSNTATIAGAVKIAKGLVASWGEDAVLGWMESESGRKFEGINEEKFEAWAYDFAHFIEHQM